MKRHIILKSMLRDQKVHIINLQKLKEKLLEY